MELFSLIISGTALLVSGAVAWWVQYRMDRRELTKWKRDSVTSAVKQISIHASRFNVLLSRHLLREYDEESKVTLIEMTEVFAILRAELYTLDICQAENTASKTREILDAFQTTISEIPTKNLNNLSMDDRKAIHTKHTDRDVPTLQLRRAAKLDLKISESTEIES